MSWRLSFVLVGLGFLIAAGVFNSVWLLIGAVVAFAAGLIKWW